MGRLSDEYILDIFNPHMGEEKRSKDSLFSKPEFDLFTLIGKRISNFREVRNPCRQKVGYGYQGKAFRVLEFSDGSMLLFEEWGGQEENYLNSYYFDMEKREVYFSPSLFETRELRGIDD